MTTMHRGVYSISGQQIAFIKENMNTMPRYLIAKELGIAQSTLYFHIKRLGGKVKPRKPLDSEIKRIVLEYYPVMTPTEMVEKFGHSKSTYHHYACELGVEHNEECKKRLRAERAHRVKKVNPYMRDKEGFSKKMRLVRRMEELRVSLGLPQQTRLRLRSMPLNYYKARWRLLNKKGYIELIGEPFDFAYDGETTRVNESLHERKYGFKFHDINDIEIEGD